MQQETADVVIIGAGAAGLAAAERLGAAGLRVVLIEARERIGGRMHTEHLSDYPLPIELGAEFIHGCPSESLNIIDQAGLLIYETNGDAWQRQNNHLVLVNDRVSKIEQIYQQIRVYHGPDQSFQSFIAPYQHDTAWREQAAMAAFYVEGFDAANLDDVSIEALMRERESEAGSAGDRSFRIVHGYDRFLAALCPPSEHISLELGVVVTEIAWQEGAVSIRAERADGSAMLSFHAPQVIITLPIGVLQAQAGQRGAVRFQPDLPILAAARQQIAMGQVIKLVLRFRELFWEDSALFAPEAVDPHRVGFVFAHEFAGSFQTWWSAYPARASQLTAWAAGGRATPLLALGEQALIDLALKELAETLNLPLERIQQMFVSAHFHNWHADPFARGAYSYVRVGGFGTVQAFGEPVAHTLYFAGEATNADGNTGTVHGAIATGYRAAEQILTHLK